MTIIFIDTFVADEQNLTLLQNTVKGPNGLSQSEEVFSDFKIEKGMKILDLGCGTDLSSIYTEQKSNSMNLVDLSIKLTENDFQLQSLDVTNGGSLQMVDTEQLLPFDKQYFDLIVSVGVYNEFGANEKMLSKLIPYVKKGGYIIVSIPGTFWETSKVTNSIHSLKWWQKLWSKEKDIELVNVNEMAIHEIAWKEHFAVLGPCIEDSNQNLDMVQVEGEKYFIKLQLIAKVI